MIDKTTLNIELSGLMSIIPSNTIEHLLYYNKEEIDKIFNIRTKKYEFRGTKSQKIPLFQYRKDRKHFYIGIGALKFLLKNGHLNNYKLNFITSSPSKQERINKISHIEIPQKLLESDKFKVNGVDRFYLYESLEACRTSSIGLVKLPTGSGKTIIQLILAYNQARELGKGLIIVPQIQIKDQFIKLANLYNIEIEEYSNYRDFIKQKNKKASFNEKAKIFIGIPKSISNDVETIDEFNLLKEIKWVLSDETHHISCETWFSTIKGLPNAHRVHGFSALPISNKNANKTSFSEISNNDAIALSVCGQVIYEKSSLELKEFLNIPDLINVPFYWEKGEINENENDWHTIMKHIIDNRRRTKFISDIIKILEKKLYKTICHVSRKEQGRNILSYCSDKSICWYGGEEFYMKENPICEIKLSEDFSSMKLREEFGENYLSIISSSHTIEGLDFDKPLDALLISEGKSNVQTIQKVGRCVRPSNRKAILVNIIDIGNKVLYKQSKTRENDIKKEFDCESFFVDSLNKLENFLK